MSALIQLTLDGSFVHDNHKVSLRVLSHTMSSIQAAADRAFLDVKYGNVAKHQRLSQVYYEEADFIVGDPRHGSFLIEFISPRGKAIVKRLRDALREPYKNAVAGGALDLYSISQQVSGKKDQLHRGDVAVQSYSDFLNNPEELVTRTYGDKSINKEFDQMLSAVRRNPGAKLKLVLKPDEVTPAETFDFDQRIAKNFKEVISAIVVKNTIISFRN